MPLVDALLPEFDHEMTTTRKLLERVPDDKFAWKPHDKSMSLGQLANHVATIPSWGGVTLAQSEFDLAANPQAPPATSRADILSTFDGHVATTRAVLVGYADEAMAAPWALKHGASTLFSMPRAGVWRGFVMSHLIHHRAQLGVYLRMQDIALPATYGPSADEQVF
jgi:uncharacterized damage-inducible protein DinB